MSTATSDVKPGTSTGTPRPEAGEMRLEIVVIPVADVARA
jgi:hypothetical protein